MKAAMTLVADINVGPPRIPLNSISSKDTATLKKDLTNMGYQLTNKSN